MTLPLRVRTLFMTPSFGTSGGEIHTLECITRWYFSDFFKEIRVVTTKRGATALRNRDLHGIKVHVLPLIPEHQHHFFSSGLFISFLVKTFLSMVIVFSMLRARIKTDLVISVSHFMHDLLPAVVFAKLTRTRLVVYVHHLHPPLSKRAKYHPVQLSLLALINDLVSVPVIKRFANMVIVVSSKVKDECIKLGISKRKVAVTMNGVNIEYIKKIPRKGSYDACFVGRIYPLKGIFDLVDIWKEVCSVVPDAKLAIIGEGARRYEDMLKKKIEMNVFLRNIIQKGYLLEDEKYATLKSCRIFVFPSYEEGWGITVCEAMACGLPVVAYDLSAYEVFGDAIITVPVGDKHAFSEAVLKLLLNEKLRIAMSKKAEIVADQFDWNKIADEELRFMKSLASLNYKKV